MLTTRMRVVSDQRADQTSGRSSAAASRLSALVSKTVSGTIKGRDRIEIGVDLAKFAAQTLDMAVDGAIVDIDIVLIGRIHQLVATAYDSRAAGKRFESQEFGDGERYILAVPRHLVPRRVHRQPPARNRLGDGLVLFARRASVELDAAKDGPNACDHEALGKGLGDIIVCPHRKPERLIYLIILAGEEDNGKLTLLAQAA